jgi:hypothetical protein
VAEERLNVERIRALTERLSALERHARVLQGTFAADALKSETNDVLTALFLTSATLRDDPDADVLGKVEETLESISDRLARIGRVT